MARVYSKEEADAILARAIDMQRGDETSHEDLQAAAKEVGIPAEVFEKAAADVMARRKDREEVTAIRRGAWRGFYAHLVPYLTVSAMLGVVNYLTTSFPWVLIVMLGWGIGLASHVLAVANPDEDRIRRRIERRRLREGPAFRERIEGIAKVRVDGRPMREEHAAEDEAEAADDDRAVRRKAR